MFRAQKEVAASNLHHRDTLKFAQTKQMMLAKARSAPRMRVSKEGRSFLSSFANLLGTFLFGKKSTAPRSGAL
jgi:hypothetical protein